jgi:hypothetical protein
MNPQNAWGGPSLREIAPASSTRSHFVDSLPKLRWQFLGSQIFHALDCHIL